MLGIFIGYTIGLVPLRRHARLGGHAAGAAVSIGKVKNKIPFAKTFADVKMQQAAKSHAAAGRNGD